ncbi:MAG: carbamate kinase [Spirochaetota bacterium]
MTDNVNYIVIALGGNAILQKKDKGTADEQYKRVHTAISKLLPLINKVPHIVITHGNGPQVGDILLRYELTKDNHPMMPLDVCNAQSQGFIGYMLIDAISDLLPADKHPDKIPIAIVTRVLVNKDDPDFKNPSKPVGKWYDEKEAEEARKMGFNIKEIEKGKFRRVVPSPIPIKTLELESVKRCLDKNMIVVASGGGGIPVSINEEKNYYEGVEAVIDKDRAGSLMARDLNADMFIILTDVDKVYLNYGKENQKALDKLSATEMKKYVDEGHFAAGSMGPKVSACLEFVEKTGKNAIITSLDKASDIFKGAGTHIYKG